MRAHLATRSDEDQRADSAAICTALTSLFRSLATDHEPLRVGLFCAMDGAGEVNVVSLADNRVITPFWPRVTGKQLVFATCSASALTPGTWGIGEPPVDAPIISPERLDVLVTPGLAFDRTGARLGQGGGFYDRLLATTRPRLVIAVAYALQVIPEVPVVATDQPVDRIVTPNATIICSGVTEPSNRS